VRPFACSFCGQRFRGEGARNLHEHEAHRN
jgi:hypothetical protein